MADLMNEMSPLLTNREAPAPMTHSLILIATSLLVLLFFRWLWPVGHQPPAWTLAPHAVERSRVRRLVLPTNALEPREPHTPYLKTTSKVIHRVTNGLSSLSAATGLVQGSTSMYSWSFVPQDQKDRNCTPLLVFVNCGSGGQVGEALIQQLRALLSPQQVVDLCGGQAEEVLQSFRTVGRFRVLVCGGDGTVGWVLSLLDNASLEYTWRL